jgi:DNA polymerase III subunit delta'
MNYPAYFDSKNSLKLFGFQDNFKFLSTLYKINKLPKVLMFTGNKGSGKATLVNHFLFSIFDEKNYNKTNFSLLNTSILYKEFKNDIFSNIIHLKGSDFNPVKIEDIRFLKKQIFQSTILDKDRFIILDDIELFNANSLNALLKIIEEPSKNNYFFLINNKSRPLLKTIKSRAIEIKIILNENQRLEIINNLIKFFQIELILDPKISQLSPGNFIKFNHIFKEYEISLADDLIENLTLLLSLYKKKKDILFINIAYFLVDFYFKNLNDKKIHKNDNNYEIKNFILENLNSFLMYNMNQKALINSLHDKLNNG